MEVDVSSEELSLGVMAYTRVLLLLLLLTSLVSASHHMGGTATYTYRGRNPDGTYKVDFHFRDTYDRCQYSHRWSCYSGNCGSQSGYQRGIIDQGTNAPSYEKLWCETETLITRNVPSDRPFSLRAASCCWIATRNYAVHWRLFTSVDLGTRSDTREPNRSPDIAILPVLRVPQNCPRTYKLIAFDPDGDKVRCRYGQIYNVECSRCDQPLGFHLDQDSCTLQYISAYSDYRSYGIEMMVEDFPQQPITLTYTDGSQSFRKPSVKRRKRFSHMPVSSWNMTTAAAQNATPLNTYYQSSNITYSPVNMTAQSTNLSNTWWGLTTKANQATSNPWQGPVWNTKAQTAPIPSSAKPATTGPWTSRPTTTATPPSPLSKLPLHFSFLVDPAVPACQPGLYLPNYMPPTPENGAHIQAEIGKEVEIHVRAQSAYSVIQDIIFSGPQNTTKVKTTHNEFSLTWTPTSDQMGNHYVTCFAVESTLGSSVYQSDMRCVVIEVGAKTVEAHVICGQSTMRVEVDKSTFPRLHEDHLQLNDPTNVVCSLQRHSNSSHVIAIVPLNACGTQIEEDDKYLKFKNEITTVDNKTELITRKHQLEVKFYCQYPKQGNVTQAFTAHRNITTIWEKGFGKFTYQFEFFPNSQFQNMSNPNSYPLEYDLGSRIYMQIEATSSLNNTELFVESCRASPYDNPNYRPTYPIIDNGCNVDSTVMVHSPAHSRHFRFSMEAFKFIGLHSQVYISCSVLMCEAGDPNTRCSKGCLNPANPHAGRRKREAVTQSSLHFISQGPIQLRRSARSASDWTEGPATNLNLNLVFIAGCLLAAVGMISGVVMYKARVSGVKYQPLPTHEN